MKLKNFAREVDRYQVCDRAAAKLANGLMMDLGHVSEGKTKFLIDHSKVRREPPVTKDLPDEVILSALTAPLILPAFPNNTQGVERMSGWFALCLWPPLSKLAMPQGTGSFSNCCSPESVSVVSTPRRMMHCSVNKY